MSEKKLASIAVHLSDTRKLQITRMAEQRCLTCSEYIHELIDNHVQEKIHELSLLRRALEVDGSLGFEGSESSAG